MFTVLLFLIFFLNYRRDEEKQCKAEDADLPCVKGLCSKFGLSTEEDTDVPSIKDSKPPEVDTLDRTGGGVEGYGDVTILSTAVPLPPLPPNQVSVVTQN